jgi:U1 small nuclear ribonucleoprotein
MTQYLPPNLLALFAPRELLPHVEPLDTLPWERKPWPYSGVSSCLGLFEDPNETPAATRGETKDERRARKRQARGERHKANLEEKISEWDPNGDENSEGDPFKTLFVGRVNYDTSEPKLRREFEQYGPIKKINLVMNKTTNKPRGYAFIIYEKERDMHSEYVCRYSVLYTHANNRLPLKIACNCVNFTF